MAWKKLSPATLEDSDFHFFEEILAITDQIKILLGSEGRKETGLYIKIVCLTFAVTPISMFD